MVRTVLETMAERPDYFIFVVNAKGSATAFRSELGRDDLNGLKTNLPRIQRSMTADRIREGGHPVQEKPGSDGRSDQLAMRIILPIWILLTTDLNEPVRGSRRTCTGEPSPRQSVQQRSRPGNRSRRCPLSR